MQKKKIAEHFKWLGIAFVIKLVLFVFFTIQFNTNYPKEFIIKKTFIELGETFTYYMPIESMADGKGYSMKAYNNKTHQFFYYPSTRRVPGIAPFYYPLLKLFDRDTAKVGVIVFQFLLSILSVYLLALIALSISQSQKIFLLTFFLYSVSSFVSIFDHYGISESFSISFLIIGTYFSLYALQTEKKHVYLIAGFFLCWSTFVRPALGVAFAFAGVLFLVIHLRQKTFSFLSFCLKIVIFATPLIISLCAWSARNYTVTKGEFIPLEDDIYKTQMYAYNPRIIAIRGLIGAWGGQIDRWTRNSMGEYFLAANPNPSSIKAFAPRMFNSQCNLDSIKQLRLDYMQSIDTTLPLEQLNIIGNKVIEKAERYTNTFKKEKPLQYYIVSPIALAGKFYYFTYLDYLPFPSLSEMKLYQKAIKIAYILFFNFLLLSAVLGVITMLLKGSLEGKLLLLFPLFYTFVMIVIFIASEKRYIAPAYPFMVIYAGYFLGIIWENRSKKISKKLSL